MTHRNERTHHLPQDPSVSVRTACGVSIDKCDRHRAMKQPCTWGAAWTRGTNLNLRKLPGNEDYPPPCEKCQAKIGAPK